ncbi:MAG: succinylglutamate desuccinylase/aspartoacylase family protein, partial [Methylobacteriaceae bacterium]|nr:succinylglutamate desuccinylase/aspartoacylase family protein [Methylobacteriaceae bacterium]
SQNRSAWGIVPIPIAVVRNGKGPTVLLTAGNHGDEYEGQIALNNLIRLLEPRHLKGRAIILPALNFPAAMAGRRVSPLDGLNLNRVFPGDPDGTPTRQIADYVTNVLVPMADAFLDLHSGGYSMDFIHTAILYRQKTPEQMKRAVAAARIWGFPYCIVLDDLGERRTIDAICRERGLLKIGTELAGGASVSVEALALAEAGVWNLLKHFGVCVAEPPAPKRASRPAQQMRLTEITGPEAYLYATGNAVFEPNFSLGEAVSAGQTAGWQHYLDEITRDPLPLSFRKDGIVAGCRAPGRVAAGDLVAVVVSDIGE